ncbi:hypothetical protein TPDSL_23200 [Terrisporobacter petrolearius]|uniref:hypothetical protein n=1 Tax=Terrisporobacter petrolearius TaxID=1460447 RepID=UPI0033668679
MKNTYRLGQEVRFKNSFEIESELSKNKLQVKEGDKAIVTRSGFKIANGEARGKILNFVDGEEVKGHDYTNIARMIYRRLDAVYGLEMYLDDEEIEMDRFLEEIEDILMDIL